MVCKSAWVRLSAFSLFSSRKNQNQEKVQWLKNIIPSIMWMVLSVIWQEKKEKHKLRYCSCSICHFGLNCLPLFLLSFPWLILIFIPPCQLFPSFSLPFPFLFFKILSFLCSHSFSISWFYHPKVCLFYSWSLPFFCFYLYLFVPLFLYVPLLLLQAVYFFSSNPSFCWVHFVKCFHIPWLFVRLSVFIITFLFSDNLRWR